MTERTWTDKAQRKAEDAAAEHDCEQALGAALDRIAYLEGIIAATYRKAMMREINPSQSDSLIDLTADPFVMVPSEDGYDHEIDPTLPSEVRSALAAWDDPTQPCKVCAASIGHVEHVTEDTYGREREGYRWVGCFAQVADSVTFLCEDCATDPEESEQ